MGDADPATSPRVPHLFVGGQAKIVAVEVVLQLDLVDFQVAPDGYKDHIAVGSIENRLQSLAGCYTYELGQTGYGLDAWGVDLLQGLLRRRWLVGIYSLGLFGIGGVAAGGTGDHRVLAGGGGQQELVGVPCRRWRRCPPRP